MNNAAYSSELSPELGPIDIDFIVNPYLKKIFEQESSYVNSNEFKERAEQAWTNLLESMKKQAEESGASDLFAIFNPIVQEATDLLGLEPSAEAFETVVYDFMPIYYALCNLDEVSPNSFAMMRKMEGHRIQDHDSQVDKVLPLLAGVIEMLYGAYDNGLMEIDIKLLRGKIDDLRKSFNPDKFDDNNKTLQN